MSDAMMARQVAFPTASQREYVPFLRCVRS